VIGVALVFLWSVVTGAAALATLPGSVELLGLSLGALLPRRRRVWNIGDGVWRVAVVVPAHNEAEVIGSCVASLLEADRGGMDVDVWVIADNCTDDTAVVAEGCGARVMERTDAVRRGKGYALDAAFTRLGPKGYDCFLVVDADTVVAANFIVAAAGALRDGAAAVQVRYLARNAEDSVRTRLMAFALRAFNYVRPLGRERLGLSAGLLGNGFGLRRDTLETVPYTASSVVEDLEYHLALVRSGRRLRFVEDSTVFGEMPVRGKGVETQRSRWEGGRLRMLAIHAPGLGRDLVSGRWRALEPLLELLLLPLAFHVVLLVVAVTSPLRVARDVGLFGLGVVFVHLGVTMAVGGGGWQDLRTLASAPFYIAWKLLLIPSLLRSARADQAWVRTSRNAEADEGDGGGAGPTEGDRE
jgi:hypothetical protein